jgi:hypothetical protein
MRTVYRYDLAWYDSTEMNEASLGASVTRHSIYPRAMPATIKPGSTHGRAWDSVSRDLVTKLDELTSDDSAWVYNTSMSYLDSIRWTEAASVGSPALPCI